MKNKYIIKFVLVCFIVYAVYQGNVHLFDRWIRSNDKEKHQNNNTNINKKDINNNKLKFITQENNSLMSNMTSNVLNKVLDNPNGRIIFEEIANKMVQQQYGIFGDDIANRPYIVKDLKVGKDNIAQCGSEVEIDYKQYENAENENQQNHYQDVRRRKFVIGNNEISINLENAIIGMHEGGERKIIFTDKTSKKEVSKDYKSKNNKRNYIVADVTLLKVINGSSYGKDNSFSRTVFIKKTNFPGQIFGPKIMCGDEIKINYKISDVEGEMIYTSSKSNQDIKITTGDRALPETISNGLVGLVKDSANITIITKFSDLYKEASKKLAIPSSVLSNKNKLVILDINTTNF